MTYILTALLIVAIATIIALIKALRIQLSKIEIYEQWIEEYEQWIVGVRNDVSKTLQTMRDLDDKQMFEKDDEVGSVFQQMLGLVEKLNQRTILENEKEEEKKSTDTT